MLSNHNKLRLAEKFKFMKNNYIKKTTDARADARTDTSTDTDTESDSEAEIEPLSIPNKKYKNAYTNHFVDALPQTIPKKQYKTIHVCTYKINSQELFPFIMFLLSKDATNTLEFPDLSGYTAPDLKQHVLTEFRQIFADVEAKIEYKGFIEDEKTDGIILVLEYKEKNENKNENENLSKSNQPLVEKGTYTKDWWWVLAAEIINNQAVLNFPIHPLTTTFLVKHHALGLLYDKEGNVYETPEIGYYGNYYKKIAAVASLGLSRESPYASFGPFYYFSNYTHAMRNAFWSNQAKPIKINEEYITVDDEGRYKKGGLVRFALFPGKTQMLLGRPTDKADDSRISQELAAKSPFVKAMLKLRDNGAKWIAQYNSIRIGQHQINTTEGKTITTNPLIALRDYEQQVPLEYYFVDTSQNVTAENIYQAVIM